MSPLTILWPKEWAKCANFYAIKGVCAFSNRGKKMSVISHCTVIDRQRVLGKLSETKISVQIQSANTKYRLRHIFYSSRTLYFIHNDLFKLQSKIKYFETHDQQKEH